MPADSSEQKALSKDVPEQKPISKFPHYLPAPNQDALEWLAGQLIKARGKRTIEQVATHVKVPETLIKEIEAAKFHLNAGQLRDIICLGYGTSLTKLLEEFYKRRYADEAKERPFARDSHFAGRFWREDLNIPRQRGDPPTPLFVGGDPERYLWAIPLRKLNKRPRLVTEFLELAPKTTTQTAGGQYNRHSGTELICILYGVVEVNVVWRESGPRELTAGHNAYGHHIHFDSKRRHYVENKGNSPALLLIVRYLDLEKDYSTHKRKKRSS